MINELHSAMVMVDGLNVHYLTGGQGDPLLVVHGGTGGARDWRDNMEQLTDKYTVYVPDMPGYGLTGSLSVDYHVPQATDFLERFTGTLGLKRFSLLGHSFGGSIALSYSLKFPYKITKLVLVSSLGLGKEIALFIRWTAHRPFCLYTGRSVLAVMKAAKWLIKRLLLPFDFDLPFCESSLSLSTDVTSFRAQTTQYSSRLSELTMPTLLIWGARDPVVPFRHAYQAGEVIPDCRVRIFNESGHSVYRERFDEFNETLRGFLG
ncbi:MAG: alpha/beta hydrolase [Dehalococcoidales bacterium]|nr:alpha/beta hydrolase [Dehalococcoidales bacterium]